MFSQELKHSLLSENLCFLFFETKSFVVSEILLCVPLFSEFYQIYYFKRGVRCLI